MSDLASRRVQYESDGLDPVDVHPDPMVQWQQWYEQANDAGCVEPNAFVLGTVDAEGWPQSRYLLARGAGAGGFVFYTNYQSAKSQQLAAAGKASMLFTWLQLHRQVRVVGAVQRAAESTSDEYFASRPRDSQLGAWASAQSQPLDSRHQLEQRVAEVSAQFDGTEVPRPPFWGGWVLQPHRFEFWQGRPSRLHDRVNYTLVDGNWAITRLSP